MESLLDDLLEYSRIGRSEDDRYREVLPGDALMKDIEALVSPPEGFLNSICHAGTRGSGHPVG